MFIKTTNYDNNKALYINSNHITSLEENKILLTNNIILTTKVYIHNDYYTVKETPEKILTLIKEQNV